MVKSILSWMKNNFVMDKKKIVMDEKEFCHGRCGPPYKTKTTSILTGNRLKKAQMSILPR